MKRSVKDEPIIINPKYPGETRKFLDGLHLKFTLSFWPYKTLKLYKLRDSALCSFLVLSGCRAGEIGIKKKQFVQLPDRILLLNVKTEKRGLVRPEIIFPKNDFYLKEFTRTFEAWLNLVPGDDSFIFPSSAFNTTLWDKSLTRKRVERIVAFKTGLFPHFLRGVHETFYGRIVFKNDAWALKEHMGLKRLESTAPYVQTNRTDYIERAFFNE